MSIFSEGIYEVLSGRRVFVAVAPSRVYILSHVICTHKPQLASGCWWPMVKSCLIRREGKIVKPCSCMVYCLHHGTGHRLRYGNDS